MLVWGGPIMMKRETKRAVLAALLVVAYGLVLLWFWNSLSRPYERPPTRTAEEQKAVDHVKNKAKIGNYTVVDCPEGIYFRLADGKKRWAVRREIQ